MRRIYTIRHATPEDSNPDGDKYREISKIGKAEIINIANKIVKMPQIEFILCSDAVRTRQTAENLIYQLEIDPEIYFDEDLYYSNEEKYFEKLSLIDDEYNIIALIGHNPVIHQLACSLSTRGEIADLENISKMHPPGTTCLHNLDINSWAEIKQGVGRLNLAYFPSED